LKEIIKSNFADLKPEKVEKSDGKISELLSFNLQVSNKAEYDDSKLKRFLM